jgi:Polyketide cyclase / dehydrase and lipid transport
MAARKREFSTKITTMAHITRTVSTTWTPEQAFDYMADFSHAAEWDPGVATSARVDRGPLGPGSAFDLSVVVGPRRIPMRYEITEYATGRVTFAARTRTLESVDTVTVGTHEGTTTVTYDARISLRGLLRVANPVLALGFRGVADRAIGGLQRRLALEP